MKSTARWGKKIECCNNLDYFIIIIVRAIIYYNAMFDEVEKKKAKIISFAAYLSHPADVVCVKVARATK